jgi:hypothetical protein
MPVMHMRYRLQAAQSSLKSIVKLGMLEVHSVSSASKCTTCLGENIAASQCEPEMRPVQGFARVVAGQEDDIRLVALREVR